MLQHAQLVGVEHTSEMKRYCEVHSTLCCTRVPGMQRLLSSYYKPVVLAVLLTKSAAVQPAPCSRGHNPKGPPSM